MNKPDKTPSQLRGVRPKTKSGLRTTRQPRSYTSNRLLRSSRKDHALLAMTKSAYTRIMVFGTFDVLHKGHMHFFKQARTLAKNPFLIVSIARDRNVARIKNRKPLRTEIQRKKDVEATALADKVILGAQRKYLAHIVKERPAIIALGYDQSAYTENLRDNLLKKGLDAKIVVLKPHKPHLYKSSIVKRMNKSPRK